MKRVSTLGLLLVGLISSDAQSPDLLPPRNAPPAGLAIRTEDRASLEKGVAQLGDRIVQLRARLPEKERAYLPDVEIFHKAVDWPLRFDEFLRSNDVAAARSLLKTGLERADQLEAGSMPWLTATGLVVRGYRSAIDGSVQPFGLVVPAESPMERRQPRRLDVWLHGRDNHLTELKFLSERQRSRGEFTPEGTIVLHPYGRYCNAFKFAGETDVFEAMAQVQNDYAIDPARISIRGFSMGGAGTWHLAVHHPTTWTAAAPGAGFADTPIYTRALAKEPHPPRFEQQLWHLYNANDYALNLFNCPTIAYSGELDKQKLAADTMSAAMQAEGLTLRHLIGPQVEHKYEPATKKELARQFDALMEQGRPVVPREIRFATWTLAYPRSGWITLEGLDQHWVKAQVTARLETNGLVHLRTTNVSALRLDFPAGTFPTGQALRVEINGRLLDLPAVAAEKPFQVPLRRAKGNWEVGQPSKGLAKRPGLQGPIDDAFMHSFLMVRPTGQPLFPELARRLEWDFRRATNEWRAQFRGAVRVKTDQEVTEADMAGHHVILWGDPGSNRLLGRMIERLPLQWTTNRLALGGHTARPGLDYPALIFPNPLHPDRYVVLNSGFTFSQFGDKSNAQQTPKLPDWALLDAAVPLEKRPDAGVLAAGFFNETWQIESSR